MIPVVCSQVEIHLFRRRRLRTEFLLLRRSPTRSLAGVWQPVTGGIEPGEAAYAAAVREVREETRLAPLRWWSLEHLTIHYEAGSDLIRVVPVFVAEVAWTDAVHLSAEHDQYAFVPAVLARRRVLWESQRRAMRAIAEEILGGGANADAREITARVAALRTAAPAKSRTGRRASDAARRKPRKGA